jgi:hypothetical protein
MKMGMGMGRCVGMEMRDGQGIGDYEMYTGRMGTGKRTGGRYERGGMGERKEIDNMEYYCRLDDGVKGRDGIRGI